MSDLKLYKGINNIDADLIEEADCKHKPAIHHCYALPATAAAIFIALGATGIFNTVRPQRKPDISENAVITSVPATSAAATSPAMTTDICTAITTSLTVNSTEALAQTSVSYSKTSIISQNSQTQTAQNTQAQTAASPAVTAAQTTCAGMGTGTSAVSNVTAVTTAVPEYDYEYEGSIIMRKYAAALAAILIASNPTTVANAQTYEPTATISSDEEDLMHLKELVDHYDLDIDINCDGNIDIFDAYAFYRAANSRNGEIYIPDYIMEKYNTIRETQLPVEKEYYDPKTNENVTDTYYYSFVWYDFVRYLFAYYPVSTDYYDPNYFIENCPDEYKDDPIPLEVQKKDIDVWDIVSFRRNMYYVQNDDGSFRPVCADDYKLSDGEDKPDIYDSLPDELKYQYTDDEFYVYNSSEVYVSPIYEFIDSMRYWIHGTERDYKMVKDIIENGYVDTDINSDGVFDFDDVVKIIYVSDRLLWIDRFDSLYVSQSEYPFHYHTYYESCPVTEEEYYKVIDLCKVAAHYFYNTRFEFIGQYFTMYYLTYNEIDEKYFDPLYYEDQGYYTPSPMSYSDCVFANLSYYEQFSIKYGPNSAQNSSEVYEAPARYNFTAAEIDSAFPTYYKNVKLGILPNPDIDLDGKITVADYNILYNLDLEYFTPYDISYIGTMIKRYPELSVSIGVSQEVRDNFDTNFDFNNNGISADELEVQCMMMYILNDLEKLYNDEDKMNKELDSFYMEHLELQYYDIFNNNMEKFNRKHHRGDSGYVYNDEEISGISSSIDTVRYYSSYDQIATFDLKGNGDANGDGTVDLSDAVLIMQSLANPSKYGVNGSDDNHITEEGCVRADVDGDGVTNMDALTIQKYLLGLCSID
ncbi:dockerin type I domain-containing protein [Ruminococcus sp.]|uniref:dockerin type I domain-containing protein n=1 Tax=Ruminococcus sp. TaxID=41978 RepID=UPI0025F3DF3F|nr:dockerin type I domain-containing protein [Ruminococcus sp.]